MSFIALALAIGLIIANLLGDHSIFVFILSLATGGYLLVCGGWGVWAAYAFGNWSPRFVIGFAVIVTLVGAVLLTTAFIDPPFTIVAK